MSAEVDGIKIGGETDIENEVVGAIAGEAAKTVDGVALLGTRSFKQSLVERVSGRDSHARGVVVEAGKKEAVLDLDLTVYYGFSIPTIAEGIRQAVASKIYELTGMIAKDVNIHVNGIDFSKSRGNLE